MGQNFLDIRYYLVERVWKGKDRSPTEVAVVLVLEAINSVADPDSYFVNWLDPEKLILIL